GTDRDGARGSVRRSARLDRLQRGARRGTRVAVALALRQPLRGLLLRSPRRQLVRLALEAQSLSPLESERRRRRQRHRAGADRASGGVSPPALGASLSAPLPL